MHKIYTVMRFFFALCLTLVSAYSFAEPEVQRSNEMEFDARVVQGQRAEGAVYLFQRASRPLPPLLSYKRDYLGAIVSPIFTRETALGKKLHRVHKQRLKIGNKAVSAPKVNQFTTESKLKKAKIKKRSRKRSSKKSPRKKWRRSKKR